MSLSKLVGFFAATLFLLLSLISVCTLISSFENTPAEQIEEYSNSMPKDEACLHI